MRVKLANPGGMFFDNDTGLRISRDEIKEVGRIGELTRQWLNGGGLIICDEEEKNLHALQENNKGEPTIEQPKPVEERVGTPGRPPKDPIVVADTSVAAKELFAKSSRATLMAMAKERGIKFGKNISSSTLAKHIVAYDNEQSND